MKPMLPSDHTKLNALCTHIASIPPRHHKFVIFMRGYVDHGWSWISPKTKTYLARLYQGLVAQGLVEALE